MMKNSQSNLNWFFPIVSDSLDITFPLGLLSIGSFGLFSDILILCYELLFLIGFSWHFGGNYKVYYCFLMNWFLLSLPLFVCLLTHKISSKQYLYLTLSAGISGPYWSKSWSHSLLDSHTKLDRSCFRCEFFSDSSIGLHCNCNIPDQESMLGFKWDSDIFLHAINSSRLTAFEY